MAWSIFTLVVRDIWLGIESTGWNGASISAGDLGRAAGQHFHWWIWPNWCIWASETVSDLGILLNLSTFLDHLIRRIHTCRHFQSTKNCICLIVIALVVTLSSRLTVRVSVTKPVIIWASSLPTILLWSTKLESCWTSIWEQFSNWSTWIVSSLHQVKLYSSSFSRQFKTSSVSMSVYLSNLSSALCGHCCTDQISRLTRFCWVHIGSKREGLLDFVEHCIRGRIG
jgi:hypothetical protein